MQDPLNIGFLAKRKVLPPKCLAHEELPVYEKILPHGVLHFEINEFELVGSTKAPLAVIPPNITCVDWEEPIELLFLVPVAAQNTSIPPFLQLPMNETALMMEELQSNLHQLAVATFDPFCKVGFCLLAVVHNSFLSMVHWLHEATIDLVAKAIACFIFCQFFVWQITESLTIGLAPFEEPEWVEERRKHCDVLGIAPTGTFYDMRRAYKKLALKWHPDKWVQGTTEERKHAQEMFQTVESAHDWLQNDPCFYPPEPSLFCEQMSKACNWLWHLLHPHLAQAEPPLFLKLILEKVCNWLQSFALHSAPVTNFIFRIWKCLGSLSLNVKLWFGFTFFTSKIGGCLLGIAIRIFLSMVWLLLVLSVSAGISWALYKFIKLWEWAFSDEGMDCDNAFLSTM